MSAELSGMVYDRPMTENQSVIEEIAMVYCDGKILKFFSNRPLTLGPCGSAGLAGSLQQTNPDIHSFNHDPAIQSGRIPVKRLRIIFEADRSCSPLRTIANSMTRDVSPARSSPLTDRARYRPCETSRSRLPSAPIAT
nr:hypothetical protein [Burkholderia ambifaria]